MKRYMHKKNDGSIVETYFHNNRSYSKEYSSMSEYNRTTLNDGMSIFKVISAPIYYPVKFVFKVLFF